MQDVVGRMIRVFAEHCPVQPTNTRDAMPAAHYLLEVVPMLCKEKDRNLGPIPVEGGDLSINIDTTKGKEGTYGTVVAIDEHHVAKVMVWKPWELSFAKFLYNTCAEFCMHYRAWDACPSHVPGLSCMTLFGDSRNPVEWAQRLVVEDATNPGEWDKQAPDRAPVCGSVIVMERCKVPMWDVFKVSPPSPLLTFRFLRDMIHLLRCLHSKAQVVHRDCKLDNVMAHWDGRLQLIDFGLAQMQVPSKGVVLSTTSFFRDRGRVAAPFVDIVFLMCQMHLSKYAGMEHPQLLYYMTPQPWKTDGVCTCENDSMVLKAWPLPHMIHHALGRRATLSDRHKFLYDTMDTIDPRLFRHVVAEDIQEWLDGKRGSSARERVVRRVCTLCGKQKDT